MQAWIERLFRIPSFEQRKTLLTLIYIFFSASTCVVGRTTADSLFLARIGVEHLALMYLVSSLVVAGAAILYVRASAKIPLRRLIAVSHLVLAVVSIILRLTPETGRHLTLFVSSAYLVSEIQGAMTAILFATLLNELFQGEHAGEIFGLVGVGSTLAGVVFGTLMALISIDLRVINLLMLMAVLHLVAVIPIWLLRKSDIRNATAPPTPVPEPASIKPAIQAGMTPLVRSIVLLASVKFLVIVLVGFQWKIAVNDDYAGTEDAIASYFGAYYALANVITAGLQLLVAGRVLHHFGVLPALLAFPVGLLLAAVSILWGSEHGVVLWAATLSKGSETLRRSFSDPALQMLFGPLPTDVRRRMIAMIGGALKPLVQAAAAIALWELASPSASLHLSYVVIGFTLLWIYLAVLCSRQFQAAANANHTEFGKIAES